jgi:hypothetical protein
MVWSSRFTRFSPPKGIRTFSTWLLVERTVHYL